MQLRKLSKAESALWHINDCRRHIFMDYMSDKAKARRNVLCVHCFVDDWPRIFIVADRYIAKGEELLSYYGPSYEDNIYAQRRDVGMLAKCNASKRGDSTSY